MSEKSSRPIPSHPSKILMYMCTPRLILIKQTILCSSKQGVVRTSVVHLEQILPDHLSKQALASAGAEQTQSPFSRFLHSPKLHDSCILWMKPSLFTKSPTQPPMSNFDFLCFPIESREEPSLWITKINTQYLS